MKHDLPSFIEDHISQVPALQLLQQLGYTYLTEDEAVELRGGRLSAVLLDGVLEQQLRKINKIRFKGEEHEFSEGNIQSAVQSLKDIPFDGLVRTNEKLYELLLWGKSLQQSIRGDTKSFPLQYIDWNDLSNNVFHVTEEFVVERTGSSGKSLTMVMLANAIATSPDISDYKVVLVTDRVDLDDQLYKTFRHCGTEPIQARTGKHLAELIASHKSRIITTVIDKFEAAVGKHAVRNENPNIFVLVDEAHRSQSGKHLSTPSEMHAKMQKVLPNACFIGFTGTPLMKKDRSTVKTFGGIIEPAYTIHQAVEDKAVVPLLYEGRHVEQKVDKESIDQWFDRVTDRLSKEQRADLKKKFATTDQLNKAQQKVMRVAWDISVHYRDNWQGTPYKAQLVTQDKSTALLYKKFLDEFGMVTSEVLISGPDTREGNEEVEETNTDGVQAFWKKMMNRFGNEDTYNKQIINAFKKADEPEIIAVVDKLLTGFDAPRNTVLYLTRKLKDHTLLQAIARVNRLYEGKEFGYIIDYRGVLEDLDSALDLYSNLSEFDKEDLVGTLTDVSDEIRKLPEKHSQLWDLFSSLRNKRDEEAYELLLEDEEVRSKFYERLSAFSRCLAIALSSATFLEETPANKVEKYKADLKFFMKLRTAVRKRYAEAIDFKEYEPKIQKLVDTYVGTGEVETITGLVNIFDANAFAKEVEKLGSDKSKADTIAFRTKRTIEDIMQEDPAFYRPFGDLLEDAIRANREQRLSDAEYLRKVTEINTSVRTRTGDELPPALQSRPVAQAFFGVAREVLSRYTAPGVDPRALGAEAGVKIDELILARRIVNWTNNSDVQNQMKTDIEDYLFDLKTEHGLDMTFEDMDSVMEQCLDIARLRYAS